MKLKLLPGLVLVLLSSLLVSCSKDDTADPDLASSKMVRTITFTNPASIEQMKYTRDSLSTIALLDEDELMILVNTQASTDRDEISLSINRELLTGTLQDHYTIEPVGEPANGEVRAIYTYESPVSSGSIYISSFDNMNGQLRISSYDSQKKLISGNYEVTIPDVYDPDATDTRSERRATISITGEFKNIRIVE